MAVVHPTGSAAAAARRWYWPAAVVAPVVAAAIHPAILAAAARARSVSTAAAAALAVAAGCPTAAAHCCWYIQCGRHRCVTHIDSSRLLRLLLLHQLQLGAQALVLRFQRVGALLQLDNLFLQLLHLTLVADPRAGGIQAVVLALGGHLGVLRRQVGFQSELALRGGQVQLGRRSRIIVLVVDGLLFGLGRRAGQSGQSGSSVRLFVAVAGLVVARLAALAAVVVVVRGG